MVFTFAGAAAGGGNRGTAGGGRAGIRSCSQRQQRRLAIPHNQDEKWMPVQETRHLQLEPWQSMIFLREIFFFIFEMS